MVSKVPVFGGSVTPFVGRPFRLRLAGRIACPTRYHKFPSNKPTHSGGFLSRDFRRGRDVTGPNTHVLSRFAWLPLFFCGLAFGQNGALRVTEPAPSKNKTIVTSEPAIPIKGTLSWTGGDMRVLWQSDRGFSDLAAMTMAEDRHMVQWSTNAPVPLRPGVNHVRIKALGQPGGADFVNIFYTPREPAPPPPLGTAILRGKQITYEAIGGRAVYQSDLILGRAEDVARGRLRGRFGVDGRQSLRPQSATIAPQLPDTTGLWPRGQW